MTHHVCPWWVGYLLISPLRRLAQDPRKILAGHVREGMVVLEPGPGLGFFTLELARMVGPRGRVIAVDVQPRMLDGLRKRAAKAGLASRVEGRIATSETMGLDGDSGRVDFVLVFAVVHEVPDQAGFLRQLGAALKPGGRMLLAEPKGHVSKSDFEETLRLASAVGLRMEGTPNVARSHAAVLIKA
jgi:ubiquinone/menaquinone biosynthesis C-methylase UbiE